MASDKHIDVDFTVSLRHQLRFTQDVLADERQILADL